MATISSLLQSIVRLFQRPVPKKTDKPIEPVSTQTDVLDLAAKIVASLQKKGYSIDKESDQINIIYIDGLNIDGTVNPNKPNQFNDVRMIIRYVNGKPTIAGAWEATTETGAKYTNNPINPKGAARIKHGQYSAWQVGIHRAGSPGGHEALVQTGGQVVVYRDKNRDFSREGDEEDRGYFGINQHHGYNLSKDDVKGASAGCLVGRTINGHKEFMNMVKSDPRYVQNSKHIFKTTVVPANWIEV